jgi:hypothetical protein
MTTMAEVLAAHRYDPVRAVCSCSDFVQVGLRCDAQTHPEHLAEVLEAAGFGNLHDAWEKGGEAAIEREHTYGREEKAKFSNPFPDPRA